MTFVNKKTRVFFDRGDIQPERKRSEARLKKYVSSIDLRAWCDVVEDRRQHILELITKGYGKCHESVIPLNTIVNAALSCKKVDIQEIQKCLNKMWSFVENVSLNDEDLLKLKQMKNEMKKICFPTMDTEKLSIILDTQQQMRFKRPEKREKMKLGPRKFVEHLRANPQDRENYSETENTFDQSFKSKRYKVRSLGPARVKTKIYGLRKGFEISDTPTKQIDEMEQRKLITNAYPDISGVIPNGNFATPSSKDICKTIYKIKNEISSPKIGHEILPHPLDNNMKRLDGYATIPNEMLGNQVIELQDQLAAREALCNEQRTNIENLKNERDKLKNRIQDCLKELEELKNLHNVANPTISSSCKDEIDALEREIRIMRSGSLSPEQDALIIQKEVDILKKYCMKLKSLEDEKLSNENSIQNNELNSTFAVDQKTFEAIVEERDTLAQKLNQIETQYSMNPNQLDELNVYRNKAEMLDNVLAERDEMRKNLDKLKEMEKENEQLRKNVVKAQVPQQTQKLRNKNDLTEIELRKTQSQCSCLQKEIQNLRREKEAMSERIVIMKTEVETLRPKAKEAEMLKLDRDKLQIKLNELSHVQIHNENLMLKCKCLETTLSERDNYKQKYEDILSMECQCDLLRNQAEENTCLIIERDSLKKQTEDLKICIHEQEDEIKRLISQIDDLVRSKNEAQSRMKDALSSMRTEVETKDSIIALSEERLATVQTQLKSSIQGVSCETICYKTRIDELERQLLQSQRTIKTLQQQLRDRIMTTNQMDTFVNMKKELEEAREENRKLQEIAKKMALLTGDAHVQKMLKQSECAVKKIVEELGKQYREWDLLRKQKNSPVSKEHVYATRNDSVASDDLEIKTELEDIRKEKEKLERIVAEIQNEQNAKSCQKMMSFLKTENAKLKDQLQKEIILRKKLEQKI